jgi:hypothetical protein
MRSAKTHASAGVAAWLLAAALLGNGGCGRDEKTTGPVVPVTPTPTTQATGVFLGGAENGLLDLTIDTAVVALAPRAPGRSAGGLTASGVMSRDGGGVVNLTGTYDTSTDSLRLTGSGYDLAGLYLPGAAPARFEGRFSNPSGSGSFLALIGARNTVFVFCATYENSAATLWGTLDFAVSAGTLAGFEMVDGDSVIDLVAGSVVGPSSGTFPTLQFAGNPFVGSGSWNTSTGHVAGTWTAGATSGVWSGDRCVPGTTGSE